MAFFDSPPSVVLLAKENLNAKHLALVSGVILAFTVYSLKIFDKLGNEKGAKRVPLVKYKIPWLGSAIELGSDPDGVFKRAAYVNIINCFKL